MEPLRYLRILRRQWRLLVGMAFVGFVVGFVTTPAAASKALPAKGDTFLAVHTLLSNGRDGAFTLDQMAYFATAGDVPVNVAKKFGGDPIQLVRQVRATSNQSLGTIEISAFDSNPDRAVQLADGFASELLAYLDVKGQEYVAAQRNALEARLDQLSSQIAAIDQAGASDDPLIKPKREAALTEYQRVDAEIRTLDTQISKSPIFSLQTASAVPVTQEELQLRLAKGATAASSSKGGQGSTDTETIAAPRPPRRQSPLLRAGMGGIIGLLAGVGVAFVFSRIDPRMHTKEDAEEAFGQPVIAELPRLTRAMQRETEVLSFTEPKSHTAEAFRYLRASIFFLGVGRVEATRPQSSEDGEDEKTRNVILITSSTPAEGKTTTVANLAAVMAESGLSVLVINCDFRKPRIHAYLGGDPTERKVVESHIPGVWVLNHVVKREDQANPAEIVAAQREVARKARAMFDVVLLDTAPLLTTNDVSELIPVSDVVLVIARAGRTTFESADRAMEVLERFKAPVVGVALVGANETPSGRYYYYYQSDTSTETARPDPTADPLEIKPSETATGIATARSRARDALADVSTGQDVEPEPEVDPKVDPKVDLGAEVPVGERPTTKTEAPEANGSPADEDAGDRPGAGAETGADRGVTGGAKSDTTVADTSKGGSGAGKGSGASKSSGKRSDKSSDKLAEGTSKDSGAGARSARKPGPKSATKPEVDVNEDDASKPETSKSEGSKSEGSQSGGDDGPPAKGGNKTGAGARSG